MLNIMETAVVMMRVTSITVFVGVFMGMLVGVLVGVLDQIRGDGRAVLDGGEDPLGHDKDHHRDQDHRHIVRNLIQRVEQGIDHPHDGDGIDGQHGLLFILCHGPYRSFPKK